MPNESDDIITDVEIIPDDMEKSGMNVEKAVAQPQVKQLVAKDKAITHPMRGRPPNNWALRCQHLVKQWIGSGAAQRVLTNDEHPAHAAIVKLVIEQAHGRAVQRTEHGSDPDKPMILEVIYRGPS